MPLGLSFRKGQPFSLDRMGDQAVGLALFVLSVEVIEERLNIVSVSLAYGLLNLIPVPCFDGGRALYGVSHLLAPAPAADVICDAVNIFFLLLLYLFSVFILFYTSFNASLLLICAYIFVKSYMQMGK